MALTLKWVGEEDLDRVAETRALCYAPAAKELDRFKDMIRADRRAKPGDFLLAERNGTAVGTTTALSMNMWVRGGRIPCQGVAFVGTIKTHRRGGSGSERGIATQLMDETIRKARERNEVVSALMPFRASYYEHFGYGLVERRNEWCVPLSILPGGSFEGFRFHKPADLSALIACRQRVTEQGQCDIETIAAKWELNLRHIVQDGYLAVDQPQPNGPITSWLYFQDQKVDGKTQVRVLDHGADSHAAFMRQLHFLASLKDQYSAAAITLPIDLPLNRLLKETQIPHRPVEHAVPKVAPHTRMQVRILDHARFVSVMRLPEELRGSAVIAVAECEGTVSRFRLDIEAGRATAKSTTASPDIECTDKQWASIVCGDLPGTTALRVGLIRGTDAAARLLDTFSVGRAPWCAEYF